MKSSFVFVALFAVYVAAQDPPTGCVLECATKAETAANCTFTDPACFCENAVFQNTAAQCFATCSEDEQYTAAVLQESMCGAAGPGTASASEPAETGSATETGAATAPVSSAVATSRSVGASSAVATTPRASSAAGSSAAASRTSSLGAASASAAASNAAGVPAVLNLAAVGTWAAVALGGAVVAQYAL